MKNLQVIVFLPGERPSIGLWRPALRIAYISLELGPKPSGPDLLAQIAKLLGSKSALRSLTHCGVMVGPASYTHVRIFVSTANTLAWTLAIPIFAIHCDNRVPDDLAKLIQTAKKNYPVEPIYRSP